MNREPAHGLLWTGEVRADNRAALAEAFREIAASIERGYAPVVGSGPEARWRGNLVFDTERRKER